MDKSFVPTPEGFLWYFIDWFNENVADHDVPSITKSEVYVVWFAYILGNAKCLISTNRPDHKYYELTYNSEKNALYVDSYLKVNNMEIDF